MTQKFAKEEIKEISIILEALFERHSENNLNELTEALEEIGSKLYNYRKKVQDILNKQKIKELDTLSCLSKLNEAFPNLYWVSTEGFNTITFVGSSTTDKLIYINYYIREEIFEIELRIGGSIDTICIEESYTSIDKVINAIKTNVETFMTRLLWVNNHFKLK